MSSWATAVGLTATVISSGAAGAVLSGVIGAKAVENGKVDVVRRRVFGDVIAGYQAVADNMSVALHGITPVLREEGNARWHSASTNLTDALHQIDMLADPPTCRAGQLLADRLGDLTIVYQRDRGTPWNDLSLRS